MYLKIAFRNIIANIRYTTITLLAISSGFISLVVFSGYIAGTYKLIEEEIKHRMMYGDIIIEDSRLSTPEGRSQSWKYLIDSREQELIEKSYSHNDSFVVVSKFLPFTGVIGNKITESMFIGLGIDVINSAKLREPKWKWNVISGVPLHESNDVSIILGEGLAEYMSCFSTSKKTEKIVGNPFIKNENPINCDFGKDLHLNSLTLESQLNSLDAEIVGITNFGFKEIDNRFVIAPIGFVQSLLDTKDVGYYSLLLKKSEDSAKWLNLINSQFQKVQSNLKAYLWKDHPIAGDLYQKSKEMLNIFNLFIVGVILLIVGLSVFNSFIKTVFERRKEIGTLRSIGYSKTQVYIMFLLESFMISGIGCLVGSVVVVIVKVMLDFLNISYSAGLFQEMVLFKILIVEYDFLFAFLLMLLLAIIANSLSLRMVLNKKIVDNLNSNL